MLETRKEDVDNVAVPNTSEEHVRQEENLWPVLDDRVSEDGTVDVVEVVSRPLLERWIELKNVILEEISLSLDLNSGVSKLLELTLNEFVVVTFDTPICVKDENERDGVIRLCETDAVLLETPYPVDIFDTDGFDQEAMDEM